MKKWGFAASPVVWLVLAGLGLAGGSFWLSPAAWQLESGAWHPILQLRLWRVANCSVIGASLALSGLIFQAVLRNPLAEPFILGISGGAALGAALTIVAGGTAWGVWALPGGAVMGALLALLLVLTLSCWGRRGSENLLLCGVIVSTVAGSILMYFVSTAEHAELCGITWYMLGDLQCTNPPLLAGGAIILLISGLILYFNAMKINVLTLGDAEAWNLGVSPRRTGIFLVLLAATLAAIPVALSGIIGFCGLIVPHLVRQMYGCDHRKTIGQSVVWGANFLLAADLLCRLPYAEREIPIGVLTSLIGGVFFLSLLKRRIYRAD